MDLTRSVEQLGLVSLSLTRWNSPRLSCLSSLKWVYQQEVRDESLTSLLSRSSGETWVSDGVDRRPL